MPRHDYGGSGDFFEARAETPYLGETFAWKLTAYAIDPGADATMTCASGRIHGPGGGGGLTDEGPGWLRKNHPSGDLRSVQVGLTAKIGSGDMIVHSTCGS